MPATSTAETTASKKKTAPRTAGAAGKATTAKEVPRKKAVDLPGPAGKKGKGPETDKSVKAKPPKIKLVRDSFTMPETEYAVLGEVKKECLKAGVAVKKSELLRVGVSLVRKLEIKALADLVAALPVLKAGRPKKDK